MLSDFVNIFFACLTCHACLLPLGWQKKRALTLFHKYYEYICSYTRESSPEDSNFPRLTRIPPHLSYPIIAPESPPPPFISRLLENSGTQRRGFWHTLSCIFPAHVVRISDPGHVRAGHQVTSSEVTSPYKKLECLSKLHQLNDCLETFSD